MKRYSIEKPPAWMSGMPEDAIRIGLSVYHAVLDRGDADELARQAAMDVIGANFVQGDNASWTPRQRIGSERQELIRFQAARQSDQTGLVWEAVLIAPGISSSYPVFYWSEDVLETAAPLFVGVDINAYELTADFFSHLQIPDMSMLENVKRYLASKKVGWIERTWYAAGAGIMAEIHFLPEQDWLPKTLQDGADAGNPDVLGLSIDSRIKGFDIVMGEMSVIWVTRIVSASSVDVVTYPAAGGKFLRAIQGLDFTQKEIDMKGKKKLIEMIGKVRPDLLDGIDMKAISDEALFEMARMAMEKAPEKKPADTNDGTLRAAQGITREDLEKALKGHKEEIEQRAACDRMLDATLGASDLPEMARTRVRQQFAQKVFSKEDLDAAVKAEKDYLAAMSQPAFELGDQTRVIVVGIGTIERAQMAVDRLFGLTGEDMLEFARMERLDHKPFFGDMRAAQAEDFKDFDQVPTFSGLREMYDFFTGDAEVTGFFNRQALPADLRASQAITSSTFTYVLGNTLARRLVKDYRAVNYREDLLISTRKPVKDFRTQEAVMVGYFDDLATVDPESADYAEIGALTDEESTYAIGQKGNLLTISRKTIINDDLSLIQRVVSRLGRAARRTHAKYVWAKFMANANCSDGTAWFTAPHANLGATALGFATAIVAYKALANMTEKDSGEKIGLLDDPMVKPVLVYPVALMETGEQIVNDDHYYASNDLTTKTRNPLRGKISGAMVSLFTDANDWGLLMPPSEVDMVEMGYLNGRQEPEMFVADQPQSEQVFVADKIRHKIRHEYAGAVVDFRSGYKAVVT